MAFLRQTDLGFETENPFAVLAHLAVHQVLAGDDLLDPVGKGVQHRRMVVQVAGLDELDLGMARRHPVAVRVDPFHQHAGKEEIGEHDDALEAQAHGMFEPRLDQREGHARIAGLAPAEAEGLPQHAHDLGDVRVGVGIGGAAPDHHQERVVARDAIPGPGQGLLDPRARGLDQLAIDRQFAAVANADPGMPRFVGVQHRGNVVLGMPGGEQHAGNRQHIRHPSVAQLVQTVTDDRRGELQKPAFHVVPGQALADTAGHGLEFPHRVAIPAAMAADHYAQFTHAVSPIAGP